MSPLSIHLSVHLVQISHYYVFIKEYKKPQMHSSVPNTTGNTRFSIDFRTVHIDDVKSLTGAPNIDSECTGTTMRDYLRGSDLEHIPEDLVARYEAGPPQRATFQQAVAKQG